MQLVSNHQFDAVVHFLDSKNPRNGDGLEESAPQQRHAGGSVKVHQLEDVDATLRHHGQAQEEHQDEGAGRELQTSWSQHFCPVVNQSRDQGFVAAKECVDSKDENHQEEEQSP